LEVDVQMVEVVDAASLADLIHSSSGRPSPGRPDPSVHLLLQPTARSADSDPAAATAVALEGVATRRVTRREELRDVLREGAAAASRTGAQSHILALLNLTRTNIATGAVTKSKLVIADLAGMGRHASKDVMRSYKALEDVLRAVAAKQRRVPFKDHVLTQVLQDCIGGSAKTLLVLALPPERPERLDVLQAIALGTAGAW